MREVKTSNHNVASVQQNPSLFCLELGAAEGRAGQAARNIGPASTSYTSVRRLQLAQSFLRIRMHALNRLGCINLQNLCGHHEEEVLRFPKHPQLAKFG